MVAFRKLKLFTLLASITLFGCVTSVIADLRVADGTTAEGRVNLSHWSKRGRPAPGVASLRTRTLPPMAEVGTASLRSPGNSSAVRAVSTNPYAQGTFDGRTSVSSPQYGGATRISTAAHPAGFVSTGARNNSTRKGGSPSRQQVPQFGGASRVATTGYPTEARAYPTGLAGAVIPQEDELAEKPKSQGAETGSRGTEPRDAITLPSFRPITAIQPHTARYPAASGPGLPNDVAQSVLGQYPPIQTWGSTSTARQSNRSTYAFRHNPLYFEDPNLERCGISKGCLTTPWSAAKFFLTAPRLPWLMLLDRPRSCVDATPDCSSCQQFGCGH